MRFFLFDHFRVSRGPRNFILFGFRARLSVWSELELVGVTLLTFQSEIVFNLADFSRFFL